MVLRFKLQLAAAFLFTLVLLTVKVSMAAHVVQQDSYPPPAAQQVETPLEGVFTPTPALPYPVNGQKPSGGAVPAPVGSQAVENEPDAVEPAQTPSRSGLVYLWLGFIATVAVLLISIFGSILLFTRRNES